MNQDFIATLRDYLSKLESDPTTGDSPLCVNIEGLSKSSGDSFWIQLHAGHINFQHLDAAEKDVTLGEILDPIENLGDVELEPGTYVMFPVDHLGTEAVDGLITGILRDYYDAGDELRLTTTTL